MTISYGAFKRIVFMFFYFFVFVGIPRICLCDEDALTEYESRMMTPNSVSFSGAVAYKVPITVPQGRSDLHPELAITYNSYLKNGWIGRGWQINVGAIQRSTKHGVQYDAFDFVADGKELVPVDIDGSGNGIYRTKIESEFKRFKFDRSTGWVVTLIDGRQYFYGQNDLSRQDDPDDPGRIFKWCLDKVVDTNYNFMAVTYEKNQGQIYLKQIDYTGNTGEGGGSFLNPTNSVVFYLGDARTDIYKTFTTNFGVTTAKRLISIAVRSQDQIVRAYKLSYHDTSGAIMSLLSNIQFFGAKVAIDPNGVVTSGIGQTLKEIELFSPHGYLGLLSVANHATDNWINEKNSKVMAGDYDGDGKVDLLLKNRRYGTTPVYFSREDGTFEVTNEPTHSDINSRYAETYPGDYDGDGKTDILVNNKLFSKTTLLLCNGNDGTFERKALAIPWIQESATQTYPGDYNGDGKTDILLKNENYYTTPVFLSNGDGTFQQKNEPTSLWINARATRLYRGDFNGDGKTDILLSNQAYLTTPVFFSNGDGSFTETNIGTDNWINEFTTTLIPGDYNGDGKTDILLKNKNYLSTPVYFSKGNGTFFVTNKSTTPSWVNPNATILYPGDYNGDGRTDILLKKEGFLTTPILFSNGDGTFDPTNEATPDWVNLDSSRLHQGDFNGDGKTDILLTHHNFSSTPVFFSEADSCLLISVKSSYGSKHAIEYSSSSQYRNSYLPFIVHPVSKITTDDGNGVLSDQVFSYSGGFFEPVEREFRGFKEITQTFPNQTMEKTVYYQGYEPICTPPDCIPEPIDYAIDNYFLKGKTKYKTLNAIGDELQVIGILEQTDYIWGQRDQGAGSEFVYLDRKINKQYEKSEIFIESVENYLDYDAVGNLKHVDRWDEKGSAEKVTKTFEYVNYGSEDQPMYRTIKEAVHGEESGLVRHTNYGYTTDGRANLERKTLHNNQGEDSSYYYEYDDYGNLWKSWDPGRTLGEKPSVEYTYENQAHTFAETMENCAGHITTKTWNYLYGQVDTETDANGNETKYTYDEFGRPKIIEYPNGGTEDWEYGDHATPRGILKKVRETTDPLSEIDIWEYFDGLDRSIQTIKMSANEDGDIRPVITRTYYDKFGRKEQVVGPFFGTNTLFQPPPDWATAYSRTNYDRRNRPVLEVYSDGQWGFIVTESQYDGLRTTVIDPDKNRTDTVEDYLGRVREVIAYTESEEQHTYYTYNAADDLTGVIDALGNVTAITPDTMGRKIYQKDPDMGEWHYQYDTSGNLRWQKDANLKEIEYAYDCLNRVENKTYLNPGPADYDVGYTYDDAGITLNNAKGRLSKVDNRHVTTFYRDYDAMGNLVSQGKVIDGDPAEYQTTYAYDLAGKVTGMIYPRGTYQVQLDYYGGTGMLKSVGPSGGAVPYVSFNGYTVTGNVRKIVYGNHVETENTYDPLSARLTQSHTARTIDGTPKTIIEKGYTYYPSGDIETIDDRVAVNTRFYKYDQRHRLISETGSSDDYAYLKPSVMAYGYDPDTDYAPPSATPLHGVGTIDIKGGANRFAYDANGNMTSGPDLIDPARPAQRRITYNADNMPVRIDHASHGATVFTYDGEGVRAKKRRGSKATYYYGEHFERVNGEDIKYIFANDQRIAMVTDAGTYYFHKDHLGSSTVITDENGDTFQETGYLPYGMQRGDSEITVSSYKFTDQERDGETGLYNYDARLYDPSIGLFVSADPYFSANLAAHIHYNEQFENDGNNQTYPEWFAVDDYAGYFREPARLNRYCFVQNNPIKLIDPNGLDPINTVDSGEVRAALEELHQFQEKRRQKIEMVIMTLASAIVKVPFGRMQRRMYAPKRGSTLDLLKNAERTKTGALKVDNATLQQIGKAEARGGKAFSGLQEKVVQSKPATWHGKTTGGQQTVIKYVDPSTGQTRFTVHSVTNSSGRVVHRDFDSVLIQSGQQVVK